MAPFGRRAEERATEGLSGTWSMLGTSETWTALRAMADYVNKNGKREERLRVSMGSFWRTLGDGGGDRSTDF